MSIEAAGRIRVVLQHIIDGLCETHRGVHPDQVVEALQVRWTAEVGQALPPIETHKALEYAGHISEGNSVTIVSA